MKFVSFVCVALLVVCCSAQQPHPIGLKLRSNGMRIFVEKSTGREMFFHGTNAIVKGPPYIPYTEHWDIDISLTKKDYNMMDELGLNVIRLGTMWSGTEPEKGQFNETYIEALKNITVAAGEFGIYSLLDMHQDVFSETFCGEGIPSWTVATGSKLGFPEILKKPYTDYNEYGYPTRQDCFSLTWSDYYYTDAVGFAFQDLYNEGETRTRWGDFWQKIASSFKDAGHILGLELLNEPWAGDVYSDKTLIIPGQADKRNLMPAYDYLNGRIRQEDDEVLLFFAAVTFDDFHPAGFSEAPGGEEYSDRSVFAYHWYSPPQFDKDIPLYFEQRMNDAIRMHTGAMLTEFDRPDDQRGGTYSDDEYERVCDAADRHLQSHAFWEWKTFCKETNQTLNSNSSFAAYGACITGYGSHNYIWNDDGTENDDVKRKLARTYAKAVAGETQRMKYDIDTGDFELKFLLDTSITAPTEIYANQGLVYSNGMNIVIEPENYLQLDEKIARKNHFYFVPTDESIDGIEVSVSLSKK
mmetsp:Transcript_14340/g.22349  ORF Transcript_14340/g.22349 Transcript_14340/m.22349 type:complete len:524 (-) Transcript_14340:51-1622(-)